MGLPLSPRALSLDLPNISFGQSILGGEGFRNPFVRVLIFNQQDFQTEDIQYLKGPSRRLTLCSACLSSVVPRGTNKMANGS